MKTKKIEKWLLLEQSGELSPLRRRLLNNCPEAQAKRAELNALRAALPVQDAEPSPWAVTKIAARLRNQRRPGLNFFLLRQGFGGQAKYWKPALALAASLMVVIGIFNFHGKQIPSTSIVAVAAVDVDVWSDPLEEGLSKLENLIMAMSGDPLGVVEM